MRKLIPLFAAIALTAPFALAADADKMPFIEKAYEGNLVEIQLGQYAGTNAGSEDVKNFGWRMQTDHTKANEDLREVAKKSGAELPKEIGKDEQQMVDRLTKLKGAEFDKAYMKMMLQDHRQDIKMYEQAAKNGKTAEIRDYATKELPVLRNHLAAAEQAASNVGVKGEGGDKGPKQAKKKKG